MLKKMFIGFLVLCVLTGAGLYLVYKKIQSSLPEVMKIEDYKPLLVSQVYDRSGKKVGEFFRERRVLIPYKEIPDHVIKAFIAAEDDQFFQHKGINLQALFRAAIANMRAGRNVQGGSTITQQVAKTLLLTNEKTFGRKIRDILLALQMEKDLTKEDILYLYLNQIYFGQSAYGIEMAAQTYFKKPAKKLTIAEAAMLAGLPKAPSEYSPVKNPLRAKERQSYVLHRMSENKFISEKEANDFKAAPIKVYLKEQYEEKAPFYMETIRQLLVEQLGEDVILNQGVKVVASLDLDNQIAANVAMVKGLKELDKRQGFRGVSKNLTDPKEIEEFLIKEKKSIISELSPERVILPNGTFEEITLQNFKGKAVVTAGKTAKLPNYLEVGKTYEAVVDQVNDVENYVTVKLPEITGYIPFETMAWARKLNPDVKSESAQIKKPSAALVKGDVILVKIVSENVVVPGSSKNKKSVKSLEKAGNTSSFVAVELDQEPVVEGSLLSIDQQTEDIIAMVGGYSFAKNEYNRALQATRQTGSSFKALVYAAALDKGYDPSTRIIDAPLVYKEGADDEGQGDEKTWKPSNHGKEFNGEITMRNALVKSLNIPSVKIVEDIGVPYATLFAQRLGIFSKLNPDFTLVLGSSSITLYEMTKVFSQFGRNGLRTRPMLVKSVTDRSGKILLEKLSLDIKYTKEMEAKNTEFEENRKKYLELHANQVDTENEAADENHFYFNNPDQLIKPEVAYVITDMLTGTVTDPQGTGGRAASLGREIAGKTGTTNGYVDAWFMGYTPNVATGVWVGFDKEKSLGRGEVGGRAALPIWLDYMKPVHEKLPVISFQAPPNVIKVKIDAQSGKLANSASSRIIEQAYVEGTEPTAASTKTEETVDHLKQDLGE